MRPYGAGGWNSCERIIDQLRNLGWEKGGLVSRKRFKNTELKAVIERNIGLDVRTYKKYRKLLFKLKWITSDDKYHVNLTDAGISKTPPAIKSSVTSSPVLTIAPPPNDRFGCAVDVDDNPGVLRVVGSVVCTRCGKPANGNHVCDKSDLGWWNS